MHSESQMQALVAALPQMRAVAQRYLSTTNNPIITHIPEPLIERSLELGHSEHHPLIHQGPR